MCFTGPPGIGKSALLDVARRLAGDDLVVCAATGRELEQGYAFGAVLQLFEPALHRLVPPEQETILAGAAGLARPLLDPSPDGGLPVADEVFDLLHGLYWVVANLAERGPLLLTVDDLQWLDNPSLRFLHYLSSRLADVPVVVVGAVRSSDRHRAEVEALVRHPAAAVHRLEPLSEAAVREMAGAAVADDVGATFHRLTAGNPLLVHELIENLAALKDAEHADASVGAVLPTVVARVRRLPHAVRTFAQACAVVGDGGGLTVAARAADLGWEDGFAAAGALIDAAILSGADPIEFVHPLVASSVLDTVDRPALSHLRGRVAAVLDDQGAPAEVVAAHLVDVAPAASRRTIDVLRRAARRALRTGSPRDAVRWLQRAMQEGLADPAEQGTILIELANAGAAADEPHWRDQLEDGLGRLAEPADAAKELLRVSSTLHRLGELDRASELAWRGIELLGETESDLALQLLAAYGMAAAVDLEARERALARVDDVIGDRNLGSTGAERALLALSAYERAIAGGGADEGATVAEVAALARRAVGASEDGSVAASGPHLFVAVLALQWCDELALAEEILTSAREAAAARGDVIVSASAANFLAPVRYLQCRPADAVADAEAAAEGFKVGWRVSAPGAAGNLALARLELDDMAGACAALELPDRAAHWIGGASYNFLLFATGYVGLAAGEYEQAVAKLLECGSRQDRMGSVNPMVMPWRGVAATALVLTGRSEEAAELAAAERRLAERFGAPRAIAAALRAEAVVAPAAERVDRLREASMVAERAPSTLELVRCRLALGGALRRRGEWVAAREPLREALDLAVRGGATRLARRAQDELAATGAKPRRIATTGPASLTPSERRVALLAAGGRKNRQIAEELFVSVKAVEYHLGNAFKKLCITRREELESALSS